MWWNHHQQVMNANVHSKPLLDHTNDYGIVNRIAKKYRVSFHDTKIFSTPLCQWAYLKLVTFKYWDKNVILCLYIFQYLSKKFRELDKVQMVWGNKEWSIRWCQVSNMLVNWPYSRSSCSVPAGNVFRLYLSLIISPGRFRVQNLLQYTNLETIYIPSWPCTHYFLHEQAIYLVIYRWINTLKYKIRKKTLQKQNLL